MYSISMLNVLNKLSEYVYFYISKNNTLYTFLLVLKIIESLYCVLLGVLKKKQESKKKGKSSANMKPPMKSPTVLILGTSINLGNFILVTTKPIIRFEIACSWLPYHLLSETEASLG